MFISFILYKGTAKKNLKNKLLYNIYIILCTQKSQLLYYLYIKIYIYIQKKVYYIFIFI